MVTGFWPTNAQALDDIMLAGCNATDDRPLALIGRVLFNDDDGQVGTIRAESTVRAGIFEFCHDGF